MFCEKCGCHSIFGFCTECEGLLDEVFGVKQNVNNEPSDNDDDWMAVDTMDEAWEVEPIDDGYGCWWDSEPVEVAL